jgi:GDP-4-dehydro-6-deoxy-D-mannose reductase
VTTSTGPVLVTGAAGFAGGHLLELLSREPDPDAGPLVAWHRPGGAAPLAIAGVSWEPMDLLEASAVRGALERMRPSQVYHCAGAAHVGRSWQTADATFGVNVRGTHHLLDGLRRCGSTARVLVVSSAMVYAPASRPLTEDDPLVPSSPYALSKLAQEMVSTTDPDGPPASIARAFNHFGPRQDPFFVAAGFARRIADIEAGRWEPEIAVGNLEARRDLTDVRDTVRAYRAIVERGQPGRVYNVCSGHAIVIRDLLDMLIARARVPVSVKIDPARYRPNDTPLVVGDPSRLRNELGWAPRIPLEQTLDDLLQYWRQR